VTSVVAELDDGEPRDDPDLTVLRDFRLVAKLWRCDQGQLRRAGRAAEPICEVPFADILTFDKSQDAVLTELIGLSRDEETFLFKLELEGFRVVEGTVSPHLAMRRF
jgi:hypothetical protein